MASKRIGYIDIAKCIAIAFIIIGHMGIVFSSANVEDGMPPEMVKLAFTFHLPVFFLASGYFFSETKAFSLDFLKKDAISLLIPYAITSLIIIIGCSVAALYHGLVPGEEAIKWLQAALWGAGSTSEVSIIQVERIGGIWFLWAMFWGHITIVLTHKLNEWTRLATLSALTALVSLSANYIWLPLSIQSGIGCTVFLYIGMLAKKHGMFDKGSVPWYVVIIFSILWLYVIINGGGMSLAMQHYPLGFIDVIGGIAAAAIIFISSRKIEEYIEPLSRFMQWIGRNTLPIFCMHIVEDNVFHWWEIGPYFSTLFNNWEGTWIVVLMIRFLVDAYLVTMLFIIPGIRKIFFPHIKKALASNDEEALFKDYSWHKITTIVWITLTTGLLIMTII